MIHSAVTDEPVDVGGHERLVADAASGAVVSFAGVVRDHDAGRSVDRLTYEGHPDAPRILYDVAAGIAARPGVTAVAVSHRIGDLRIGDVA